jgi:hypothetical protein
MADKNIQMKEYNGSGYDNLYPKTTAGNVTEETNKKFVTDAQKAALDAMGDANGVLQAGADGRLPANKMPTSAMEFKGSFGSAGSSTGGDVPASADAGDQYVCDTNSYTSTNAGATFNIGDMAMYDGADWVKIDSSDAVNSVNGKTGSVTLTKTDIGLGSVENYGIASQAEAEAGTVANKYMTPAQVKQAILALSPSVSPEEIQDIIGTMVAGNTETNITVDYDDATGKLNFTVANATTSAKGVVQLSSSVTSTSASLAATASAVKQAYDKGNEKTKIVVQTTTPSTPSAGDHWYQEV